jgi:hypothetical protein
VHDQHAISRWPSQALLTAAGQIATGLAGTKIQS